MDAADSRKSPGSNPDPFTYNSGPVGQHGMVDSSSEDAANVLKGQVDSVYEAKAMVLNRAASQLNGCYYSRSHGALG